MESVNGGLESDCKGALVSLGMGVAGVVLSAASLGSGPVGWVSGLSYGLSLAGTSFSGIQTIGSCFSKTNGLWKNNIYFLYLWFIWLGVSWIYAIT